MSERNHEVHHYNSGRIAPSNITEKNAREYLEQNLWGLNIPKDKMDNLVRELQQVLRNKKMDKKRIQNEWRKSLEKLRVEADMQRLRNVLERCESNFNELNKASKEAWLTDKVFDLFTWGKVSKTLLESYNNSKNMFIEHYSRYVGLLRSGKIKLTKSQKSELEAIMKKWVIVLQTKLESPTLIGSVKNQFKNTWKQIRWLAEKAGKKMDKKEKHTVVIEYKDSDVAKEIRYANWDLELVFANWIRQIFYNSWTWSAESMIVYADKSTSVRYRSWKAKDVSFDAKGKAKIESYRKSEESVSHNDNAAEKTEKQDSKKQKSDKLASQKSENDKMKPEPIASNHVDIPSTFSSTIDRKHFFDSLFSSVDSSRHMSVKLPNGFTFELKKTAWSEAYTVEYGWANGIKHEWLSRKEVRKSLSFAQYANSVGLWFLIPHSREILSKVNSNGKWNKINDRDWMDLDEKMLLLSIIGPKLIPGYIHSVDLRFNENQFTNVSLSWSDISRKSSKLSKHVWWFSNVEMLAKALYPKNGWKEFDSVEFLGSLSKSESIA
ncbi:MAG: hypothetical protein ACD_2C00001G0021 [uncultured bacterium (gcode 4)]|uniref:Uncharacterized protein n=1 Tax=uncultured bacterium (gcode 4) TaxID=1234023 RepID=K2FGU6_9BACT|nr:MAG: hypothetical protein ACD_2C00001G0021 [uncultured bacterium (gcode 4)]